jgi:hypothetical protein
LIMCLVLYNETGYQHTDFNNSKKIAIRDKGIMAPSLLSNRIPQCIFTEAFFHLKQPVLNSAASHGCKHCLSDSLSSVARGMPVFIYWKLWNTIRSSSQMCTLYYCGYCLWNWCLGQSLWSRCMALDVCLSWSGMCS